MKNKSIDKMAEQFTSLEELQAYCDSQYKTILSLNQKITAQEAELNKLREENTRLSIEGAVSKAPSDPSNPFATTDGETVCITQLAILKNHAMSRELVTDEVKRLEVLVKTLLAIQGRDPGKKKDKTADLSPEELLKHLDDLEKNPQ